MEANSDGARGNRSYYRCNSQWHRYTSDTIGPGCTLFMLPLPYYLLFFNYRPTFFTGIYEKITATFNWVLAKKRGKSVYGVNKQPSAAHWRACWPIGRWAVDSETRKSQAKISDHLVVGRPHVDVVVLTCSCGCGCGFAHRMWMWLCPHNQPTQLSLLCRFMPCSKPSSSSSPCSAGKKYVLPSVPVIILACRLTNPRANNYHWHCARWRSIC